MKKTVLSLMVAGALLAGSANANANLIQNGSFEDGNLGTAQDVVGTFIPGWTVIGGNVDLSYGNASWWQAADGLYSLDMNGSQVGSIKSNTFNTVAGQLYNVSFAMAGNSSTWNDKSMDVLVNGSNAASFTFMEPGPAWYNGIALQWSEQSFNFIANSAQTFLTFASTTLDTPFQGVALDNVVVEAATAPVPEPGTMMLLGAGFLGLAIFGKRRKNA